MTKQNDEKAAKVERMRSRMMLGEVTFAPDYQVTASIGVASDEFAVVLGIDMGATPSIGAYAELVDGKLINVRFTNDGE